MKVAINHAGLCFTDVVQGCRQLCRQLPHSAAGHQQTTLNVIHLLQAPQMPAPLAEPSAPLVLPVLASASPSSTATCLAEKGLPGSMEGLLRPHPRCAGCING
jgi:hypothetical protein